MIRPSLAHTIISEVRKLLDEDLIVVDPSGTIIASTDKERMGSFHEGALISYNERRRLIITQDDESKLTGVKAGINLPIFFQDQVVGVIGITGDPSKVSAYGELLRKMTELLIKEKYYAEQLEWHARTLEAFVFDWVQQKEWTRSFINQAKMLHIDLTVSRQVIIGYYGQHNRERIQREWWIDVSQTFTRQKDDLLVRWGNDRFVMLLANKAEGKERAVHSIQQIQKYIQNKYRHSLSFGVGQSVCPQELYRSFEQAERALAVAVRTQSIVFEEDLRLDMCLQDVKKQTRVDFVQRTLEPIMKDEDLLETLKTFIARNQSFKETAETLHIHINTLHYRLKKMEDKTGLNPRDFHDLTTLYLGLLFLEDDLKN
ncbi:sugar diacid recognition domain-containing protein [Halalkalibacterium halodurans]|jgi:carbohydrate diacid regulator|uniref:CdaR family transcriptional regulator n=1 Tax=Halalkalibacterium halodurans TaxID=86665 RepID=UPI002E1DDA16|nr:sugar diacid recognition domain-containing protein [Halalkalibacterium halodurans]